MVASGCLALILVGTLAKVGLAKAEAGRLIAASRSHEAQLQEESRILQDQTKSNPRASGGKLLVSEFQEALEQSANEHACIVTETVSSSDVGMYLTAYGGEAVPGWQTVQVRASLVGRAGDVLATLQALESSSILYEITALDLARSEVDSKGQASVAASVDFKLLRKVAG